MRMPCLLVPLLLFLVCAAGKARADFAGGEPATFALFHATVPYGGAVRLEEARAVASSRAEDVALFAAMRALAKQPVLAFLGSNDGNVSFSPPSLEGLARMLCLLEPVRCDNDTGAVTCTVKAAWPRDVDMQRDIPAALQKTALLDRYEATARRRKMLLSRYDRLVALLNGEAKPDEKIRGKEELEALAAELKALPVYLSSLAEYDGRWKDPAGASHTLENALQASPGAPLLLAGAAEALIQLGHPVKAHAMIDMAIEREPDIAFFHDLEGTALLQQNLPALAADAYDRAVSLGSGRSVYRAHRGYALYLLGDEEAMCKDFRAACAGGDCSGLAWSSGRGYCVGADAADMRERDDGTVDGMEGGKSVLPPSLAPPNNRVSADAVRNATQKTAQPPDVPEIREE